MVMQIVETDAHSSKYVGKADHWGFECSRVRLACLMFGCTKIWLSRNARVTGQQYFRKSCISNLDTRFVLMQGTV
jgi:hypothetical protein